MTTSPLPESPGRFALDQWYVVAITLELPAGRPRRTELMDRPIRAERDGSVCPNAHALFLRCVFFPLYPLLTKDQIDRVARVLSTLP